jgi:dTDP-4-amino-4,6-dideoxygalactose transaminase
MTSFRIPFNRADLCGDEMRYLSEAVRGGFISGNGPFCRRCEELLQEILGSGRVLLTTSCTSALEMAALLLDLKPGDEVIVPSFTFVSTAGSFALHGARPVFADVRQDTLNLDECLVESLITSRTRAIVPVHYGGIGSEMDQLARIAGRHGVILVEDAAQSLFGEFRGRKLGTIGSLGALSFHETKNITCGEGGALIVNDPGLVERALVIRDKGTDRSRFLRGQVDRYTWVDAGASFVLSDLLAAFLLAQLEGREAVQRRRKTIWDRYMEGLSDWASGQGVSLPFVPAHCTPSWHLFHLMMPDEASRAGLIERLGSSGILSVFHYQPLHLSAMGAKHGGRPGQCPVSERAADRLLRLPFFASLLPGSQDEIISVIQGFRI